MKGRGLPFAWFGFVDVAVEDGWSGGEASSGSGKGMMRSRCGDASADAPNVLMDSGRGRS